MGCLIENDRIILKRYMGSVKEKERKLSSSYIDHYYQFSKTARHVLHTVTEMRDLRKTELNLAPCHASLLSVFHAHFPSNFHLLIHTFYSRMFHKNRTTKQNSKSTSYLKKKTLLQRDICTPTAALFIIARYGSFLSVQWQMNR